MPASAQTISGGQTQVTVTFLVKQTSLLGDVDFESIAHDKLLAEVKNVAQVLDDGVRETAELIKATQG